MNEIACIRLPREDLKLLLVENEHLRKVLIHIKHLSKTYLWGEVNGLDGSDDDPMGLYIKKANNVLLAIHETAAGKITTVNSQRKGQSV